jgi:hypothetical protein
MAGLTMGRAGKGKGSIAGKIFCSPSCGKEAGVAGAKFF